MRHNIYILLLLSFAIALKADSDSDSDCRGRLKQAFNVRKKAACFQLDRDCYDIEAETPHDPIVGKFTKSLAHLPNGLPSDAGIANYERLVKAMRTGRQKDFNAIVRAFPNSRKLGNPQAALAFSLQGADSSLIPMPKPPKLSSAHAAADLIELYLMAICRDVRFVDYGTGMNTDNNGQGGSFTNIAAAILQDLGLAYRGPRENGVVTANVLFRGDTYGSLIGPYISQFLLVDLRPLFDVGLFYKQLVTIASAREFGVSVADYVAIQDGLVPRPYNQFDFGPGTRYAITGRDLATVVHTDGPYEFYYNALNVLISKNFPFSPALPYQDGTILNEAPFTTMGGPDAFSLVGGVCVEALKHAWAHKWLASRRLRPDAMAGLVHLAKTTGTNPYHLNSSLFTPHAGYDVLQLVFDHNVLQASLPHNALPLALAQTYLLGQVYPEGSPVHPSYPGGHAVIAAACTTVIKAIFDDQIKLITKFAPVKPNPANPTQLIPLVNEGETVMTVASELDKLASNATHGRDWAGIHYRSDSDEGCALGEKVAIAYLQDQARTYHEQTFTGFVLTKRDGTRIRITKDAVQVI